jgi:hypothetical protein
LLRACVAACLALATLGSTLRAQTGEGPLDNDTEVPASAAALSALRAGDEALAKLGARASDPQALVPVLESWRNALNASAPGEAVAIETDAPPIRAWQSVDAAVEARVQKLGADGKRAFAARFGEIAERELDAAGDEVDALARVEHSNPWTRAAAVSALRLGDLAFESGQATRARSAWRRSSVHAAVAGEASLAAAIAARERVVTAPTDVAVEAAEIDAGRNLKLVATIETGARGLGRHLRPGLGFDDAKNAWLQCGETLVRVGADLRAERFSPADLAAPLGVDWEPAFGEDAYDWLQRPACDGARVFLVCGRAKRDRGNALVAFENGAVAWAYGDGLHVDARGARRLSSDLLLPGRLEFQPGPRCADGSLFVLVRQWNFDVERDELDGPQRIDEARTTVWLAALDGTTGIPRWTRTLAAGADLRARDRKRFMDPRGVSWPCAPLALREGHLFADTSLGVAALVEIAGGGLEWSFKSRRVIASDARFRGAEPRAFEAGWLWAPADADRVVYRLGRGAGDPRLGPPERIEGLLDVFNGSQCALDALVDAGGRAAPAILDTCTGARVEGLAFGRAERPKAFASTSRRLVCAAGGALVLLDRERDLYRLDEVSCPGLAAETACSLHVRGKRVYLVGLTRAWIVDVE